jgi:heme exporter protein A
VICEQLITEVVRSVWRSRCRTYRHTVRPDDAKQEAFLACWRYRGKHDPSKSPARAYMWMVANHAITWADNRAKKARKMVGKSLLSVDVGADGDELSLLRALAGLGRPAAGEVRWNGALREPGSAEWHSVMLYQGHSAGWKDTFSARDNLALQRALDSGLQPGDGWSEIDELLERCGLQSRTSLSFARLSAGQRHRLSLARLAGSKRRLWLLDEPTTALDGAGQELFGQLLSEHLTRGGCAVIATHLPIACDQVAVELDLGTRSGTAPSGQR